MYEIYTYSSVETDSCKSVSKLEKIIESLCLVVERRLTQMQVKALNEICISFGSITHEDMLFRKIGYNADGNIKEIIIW